MVAGSYFLTKNETASNKIIAEDNMYSSKEINNSSSSQNKNHTEKSSAMHAKSELSLDGIDIGINIDTMHSLLGKEKSKKIEDKYQYFYYDNLSIGVKDGNIDALVSDNSDTFTKRGIHPGSTLQDVILTYGENYLKSHYEDLILYEYKYVSINNQEGLIRFAVNQSDKKVNYISVRIPETTNTTKKKSTSNQNDAQHPAIQVLYNFHKNITNKEFRLAYDCFSKKMQGRISYEGWVPGFKTTVSSTPSDVKIASKSDERIVLTYYLTAVDNPGGTQVFTGTAVLVNTNSGWKLDEITNKTK